MLRELRIKNFAVIDEVGLELQSGLNIITGETGAGKSIILNALGLIAGERGSSEVIRSQEEEATVEALFEGLSAEIENKLGAAGFETNGELVIKRIVNRSSKNVLAHSEKLYQGCREGEELLYEGEAALVSRLGKYTVRLRELSMIDHHLQPSAELLDSSLAQLQEAAAQLRRYAERVHFDPG